MILISMYIPCTWSKKLQYVNFDVTLELRLLT